MYIVAVLSFIRHHITQLCEHLTKDVALPLRERWVTINAENEAPIIQRRLENKPTVLQQSKGGSKLSFNEIIEKRDELPIGSIERLLIAMYTMIPPCRADYFAMEVIRGEVQPTAKNYLRIRSDDEKSGVQMETVLRDFKTAKIFKEIRNELPVELIKEVEASLEKTPRGYLFINANGKPHTRNSFTMWSRRVLSRVFGTDFTLVFFRHAFATHYVMNVDLRTLTDAQIKEISDKLGHSTEMFRAYRWIRGEEVESGGESDEE
jgi:integrase